MKKIIFIGVLILLMGCGVYSASFEETCKSAPGWRLEGSICSHGGIDKKHSFTWNCEDGNKFVYNFGDIKEYKEPKELVPYLKLKCRDLEQK